jgi:hypothetical protein
MKNRKSVYPLLLFAGILFLFGTAASGDLPKKVSKPGGEKLFVYTAKKLGMPFLKASIRIGNAAPEAGKSTYEIEAHVDSRQYMGLFFKMNNRFLSVMDMADCSPVRYVKEIDQEGLFIPRKNYLQTLFFDHLNNRVVTEKKENNERQEVSLPPDTYDPLSMFGRCYFKEDLRPGQDISMSLYDGVKLRKMVFHSKKGKVASKLLGEVEAICLESSTPFAAFGEKEGIIRIWYTTDERRIPVSIELDLPVGMVKFELEEMKEG